MVRRNTPTTSKSLREEVDLDHMEVISKHSDLSDISENNAQKIAEFEKRLEAMANRDMHRKTKHDQPYPKEWDAAEYLSKFKVSALHYFDGTGSPTQYLYYFRVQTQNIAKNNVVLTWLFVSSLKD